MNRERWLLLASILILGSLGIYYFRPGGGLFTRKKSPGSVVQPLPARPAAQGVTGQKSQGRRVKIALVDEHTPWGRNPFLREEEVARKKGTGGGSQIRVTLVGPPGSVASIDGRTVVVGDRVGEETVLEIHSDAVVLGKEGRRRILRVSEPFITVEVKEGKR